MDTVCVYQKLVLELVIGRQKVKSYSKVLLNIYWWSSQVYKNMYTCTHTDKVCVSQTLVLGLGYKNGNWRSRGKIPQQSVVRYLFEVLTSIIKHIHPLMHTHKHTNGQSVCLRPQFYITDQNWSKGKIRQQRFVRCPFVVKYTKTCTHSINDSILVIRSFYVLLKCKECINV